MEFHEQAVVLVVRQFAFAFREDVRYSQSVLILLDKGQIAEIWEFVWDLYAVDDFWS